VTKQGMPQGCISRYIHRNFGISTDGKLINTRHKKQLSPGEFCLERSKETGKPVAITCNACEKTGCIQLCCPRGQILVDDPDWGPQRCQNAPPPRICKDLPSHHKDNKPNFHTYRHIHHTKDFVLMDSVAGMKPSYSKFSCKPDTKTHQYHLMSADTLFQTMDIHHNGTLEAFEPDNNFTYYNQEEYCFVHQEETVIQFADEEPLEQVGSNLSHGFMVCIKAEKKREGEHFTTIFYPTALLISSVFLMLTFITYILDPDLHKPLFGKITIGFVTNLLVAFLSMSYMYISKHFSHSLVPQSGPCITVGYIILYTFTAFFFWMNAMAINICLKFSAIMAQGTSSDNTKLFCNIFYAQGSPLVLCLIIAAVDVLGPCEVVRPNMGLVQCFLGAPRDEESRNYFASARFVFFDSILLVIQLVNIVLFIVTVVYLAAHWKKSSQLTRTGESAFSGGDHRGNFLIVLKLFMIMGIQWVGEVISQIFTHQDSEGKYLTLRLICDTPNLFTGVLIFIVLVCKKKTVQRVRSRISRNTSKYSQSSGSMFDRTRDTLVSGERDSSRRERIPLAEMKSRNLS